MNQSVYNKTGTKSKGENRENSLKTFTHSISNPLTKTLASGSVLIKEGNINPGKGKKSVHYSGITREWNTSIYSYNKEYIKSLIYKNVLVKYLLHCYLNMNFASIPYTFDGQLPSLKGREGNVIVKQKRINAKRFSVKKIFSSNIYIKHTNSLVILTLFIFNKKNNIILNTLKKLQNFSVLRNKTLGRGSTNNNIKAGHKNVLYNSLLNSVKNRIVLIKAGILGLGNERLSLTGKKRQNLRKYKLTLKKNKYTMLEKMSLSVIRKKRLFNIIKFYNLIKLLGLNNHEHKLVEKNKDLGVYSSKLSTLILNFIDPSSGSPFLRSNLTRGKFLKNNFLNNLISSVYYNQLFLFNKFKFTYLFLNFKGFGLINIIEKIFGKKVQFNIISLKAIHLNSDMLSESIAKKLTDRKNKLLTILNKALRKVKLPVFHSCLIDNSFNLPAHKDNILNTIRYKTISGIRFEASGRLTRRLIASRSIFKIRYIGNIKNMYSSYKQISSPILRGYLKSSLQYTLINSKTRNGSFGLKGWVSSY